jgi:hypothetical protein
LLSYNVIRLTNEPGRARQDTAHRWSLSMF